LAGSGYPGERGDYTLQLTAADLDLPAGGGPVVLTTTPGPEAALDRPPLAIRLDLSAALDPKTVVAGQTVRLTFKPAGASGPATDKAVALAKVNFTAAANELQLFPTAALAPGFYRVWLYGDTGAHASVLKGPGGVPLGEGPDTPQGQDFTL